MLCQKLVRQGLAYPCFCTPEQLGEVRQRQEAAKQRTGYYGAYAACRDLSPEEALERLQSGRPYVVRLRSPGSEERRVKFDDMIKGTIEMPENDQDIVLLKSDGIPTYHFAHAVDDHLMRTPMSSGETSGSPRYPSTCSCFRFSASSRRNTPMSARL